MTIKFFDFDGHEVSQYDTEAKTEWCQHGSNLEETFVHLYGHKLNVGINPDKGMNKYAPDLIWHGREKAQLGDLKTQNTPFFSAKKYGAPPQFAITFNQCDLQRYLRDYPDLRLYFWVNWKVRSMLLGEDARTEVAPMVGVWGAMMGELEHLCSDDKLHCYQRRQDDANGNAKASYVLDLRDMNRLL